MAVNYRHRTPEKDVDEELARLREDLARLRTSTPLSPKPNGKYALASPVTTAGVADDSLLKAARSLSPPRATSPGQRDALSPAGSPGAFPFQGTLEDIQNDLRTSADKYATDLAEQKRRMDVLWKHYLAGEVRPDAQGQTPHAAVQSLSARVQRLEEDARPRLRAVEEQAQAVSREVLRLGGLVERLGARELPEILDKVAAFEEARLHMADVHAKATQHAQVLEDQVGRVGELARGVEALRVDMERSTARTVAVQELASKTASTVDALSDVQRRGLGGGAAGAGKASDLEVRRLDAELSALRSEIRELRLGAARAPTPSERASPEPASSGPPAAVAKSLPLQVPVVGAPPMIPLDVPEPDASNMLQVPSPSPEPDTGSARGSIRRSPSKTAPSPRDQVYMKQFEGRVHGSRIMGKDVYHGGKPDLERKDSKKRAKSEPPAEPPVLEGHGARLWVKKRDHDSMWGKVGGFVTRFLVLDGARLEWHTSEVQPGSKAEPRGYYDFSQLRQGKYFVEELDSGQLVLHTPAELRNVDFRPHSKNQEEFLPFSVAVARAVSFGEEKYAYDVSQAKAEFIARGGADEGEPPPGAEDD